MNVGLDSGEVMACWMAGIGTPVRGKGSVISRGVLHYNLYDTGFANLSEIDIGTESYICDFNRKNNEYFENWVYF